jgi:hypothetical protein
MIDFESKLILSELMQIINLHQLERSAVGWMVTVLCSFAVRIQLSDVHASAAAQQFNPCH